MAQLAYIPSPSISSFQIGGLTIRFYAVVILIGICVAVWLTTVRWKKVSGTFDQILDITIVAVPTGIIGARIYHVVTTPNLYFGKNGHFTDIFKIWNGGLGIWGAVLLGGLCVWAWCRHAHYPVALLMDAVAPGLLIAQAIGRLGNWFNQELYGAPTTLPWGLKLNENAYAIGATESCYDGASCPTNTLFHPTFLYEMIWNLVGAAILIGLTKFISERFKAGSQFALYIMWYTAGRTWIEALRIDFSHTILGLRVNIWVSLITFIFGVVLFVLLQRTSESTERLSQKLAHVSDLESEVSRGKMTGHQLRQTLRQETQQEETEKKQDKESKKSEKDNADTDASADIADTADTAQNEDESSSYDQAKALIQETVSAQSSDSENTTEE